MCCNKWHTAYYSKLAGFDQTYHKQSCSRTVLQPVERIIFHFTD